MPAAVSDAGAGAPLTPELITGLWRPTDVRIAPGGRRVAWAAAPFGNSGAQPESAIWVASLDGPPDARCWSTGANELAPRWSPDGAWLAFRSDRARRGVAGLCVLPGDGDGEPRALVSGHRAVGGFAWSPDARRIAFAAPDEPDTAELEALAAGDDAVVRGRRRLARVRVVDLGSGAVRTFATSPEHVVEIAWSPDGATLALRTQPTPDDDAGKDGAVQLLPVAGGAAVRVCAAPWGEDLAWSADGTQLVFVARQQATRQDALTVWSVPARADAPPRPIGSGPRDTTCALGVRAVPGETRVAIVVADGLATRLEWRDPHSGAAAPLWESAGDFRAFDVGAGGLLAVGEATPRRPCEVRAGTPGALVRRSAHGDALAGVALGALEEFHWTAPDGLALDGLLIRPPGAGAGPHPTIMLLHGGPYYRLARQLLLEPHAPGHWLASGGYAVLVPNYRGGMGHGQRFAACAKGDMGGAEWQDVLAAVDAAVARGIADPARLGVSGWSQGGFLTAWAVTQTDRFRAAVMGAGISDWRMMVLTGDSPSFERALLDDEVPWDGHGPFALDRRSPLSYARRVTTPLLILHGEADPRVPPSQATAFHRALVDVGAPVELVTYPREHHVVKERAHQHDLLRRYRGWFDRWLVDRSRI